MGKIRVEELAAPDGYREQGSPLPAPVDRRRRQVAPGRPGRVDRPRDPPGQDPRAQAAHRARQRIEGVPPAEERALADQDRRKAAPAAGRAGAGRRVGVGVGTRCAAAPSAGDSSSPAAARGGPCEDDARAAGADRGRSHGTGGRAAQARPAPQDRASAAETAGAPASGAAVRPPHGSGRARRRRHGSAPGFASSHGTRDPADGTRLRKPVVATRAVGLPAHAGRPRDAGTRRRAAAAHGSRRAPDGSRRRTTGLRWPGPCRGSPAGGRAHRTEAQGKRRQGQQEARGQAGREAEDHGRGRSRSSGVRRHVRRGHLFGHLAPAHREGRRRRRGRGRGEARVEVGAAPRGEVHARARLRKGARVQEADADRSDLPVRRGHGQRALGEAGSPGQGHPAAAHAEGDSRDRQPDTRRVDRDPDRQGSRGRSGRRLLRRGARARPDRLRGHGGVSLDALVPQDCRAPRSSRSWGTSITARRRSSTRSVRRRSPQGEAGGITQHIGAYRVAGPRPSDRVPRHARATRPSPRCAPAAPGRPTSSCSSWPPTTASCLRPSRRSTTRAPRRFPIVVAINKIDKPNANPDRVRKELADRGVLLESWGGDVPSAEISALKKQGIDQLLELHPDRRRPPGADGLGRRRGARRRPRSAPRGGARKRRHGPRPVRNPARRETSSSRARSSAASVR